MATKYCLSCMRIIPENVSICPYCSGHIPYTATHERDCPAGTILQDRYMIGKAIGRGGFGVTYIGMDLERKVVVCIKEFNPAATRRDQNHRQILLPDDDFEQKNQSTYQALLEKFHNECALLKRLSKLPAVVEFYDRVDANNTSYLIMEYLDGQDLKHHLKSNAKEFKSQENVVQMMAILLRALKSVHDAGVYHRDISPDNFFFKKNGQIRIIDFGSARDSRIPDNNVFAKRVYVSPEVASGQPDGAYSEVYSMGVVLYFLLCGDKPAAPATNRTRLPDPQFPNLHPALLEIYRKAVSNDVAARYQTVDAMLADIEALLFAMTHASPSKPQDKRIILISVLTVIMLALIGLIIAIGMVEGDSPSGMEFSTVTPTPASTPSPTPTSSPVAEPSSSSASNGASSVISRPVFPHDSTKSESPSPAQVTPSPASPTATPTATSTAPPTATPTVKPGALATALQSKFVLIEGSELVVNVSYQDQSVYDIAPSVDADRIASVQQASNGRLIITGHSAGETSVSYLDGGNRRSFTVRVLTRPVLTEAVQAMGSNAYSVEMYEGQETFIPLEHELLEGMWFMPEDESTPQPFVFSTAEGGIVIKALSDGEASYRAISTGTDQESVLFTLHAKALYAEALTNHFEALQMIAGQSYTIPLTFRDGRSFLPTVCCSDEKLVSVAVVDNELRLKALASGAAQVTLGSPSGAQTRMSVQVYDAVKPAPALILLNKNLYQLSLTEGISGRYQLVQNTPYALSLIPDSKQEGDAPTVDLFAENGVCYLSVTAEDGMTGSYDYLISTSGLTMDQPLFRLRINVAERMELIDLTDSISLLSGQTISLPLTFRNGSVFQPEIHVENDEMASARVENGQLLVTGRSSGETMLSLVSPSGASHPLRVNIVEGLGSIEGFSLNENGAYEVSLYAGDNVRMFRLGNNIPYALSLAHLSGEDVAQLHTDKQGVQFLQVNSQGSLPGNSTYQLLTSGLTDDLPLATLTIRMIHKDELVGMTDQMYTLVGQTVTAELQYSDNIAFVPQITVQPSGAIDVSLEGSSLHLTPRTAGVSAVTLESPTGQQHTIHVQAYAVPTIQGLRKNSGVYTLNMYTDSSRRLDISTDSGCQLVVAEPQAISLADVHIRKSLSGQSLEISSGSEVGQIDFTLKTSGLTIDEELLHIRVNIEQLPELTTEFSASEYCLVAGETRIIPLAFSTDPFALEISTDSDACHVWQEDSRLFLHANGGGTTTVLISDGLSNRQITIQSYAQLDLTASAALQRDSQSGEYNITLQRGDTSEISLGSGWSASELTLQTDNPDVCRASLTNRKLHLTAGIAGVCRLLIQPASHGADNSQHHAGPELIAAVTVTVESIWQLSPDRIDVLADDTSQIIESLVTALNKLGALKGNVQHRITTAIDADGGLSDPIWKAIETVRSSNTGFSSQPYLTQADYSLLMEMVLELEQEKAVTASEQTRQHPLSKAQYQIVDAALANGQLWLLDQDGYLLPCDPRTLQITGAIHYSPDDPTTMLTGNGQSVMTLSGYNTIGLHGSYDSLMADNASLVITSYRIMTLAQDSVLLVLDAMGEYAWSDNESDSIIDGAAVYWKTTGKNALAPVPARIDRNQFARQIIAAAAGDSVIAFVNQANGRNTLYLKSTRSDTVLQQLLKTNLAQDSAVFARISKPLQNREVLNPRAIAVSDSAVAIVQQDGTVQLLGQNAQGCLGVGDAKKKPNFSCALVNSTAPLQNIMDVVLLDECTLFLAENGQVWYAGAYGDSTSAYAAQLPGIGQVSRLIRLDGRQVLAVNRQGQVALLHQDTGTGTMVTIK